MGSLNRGGQGATMQSENVPKGGWAFLWKSIISVKMNFDVPV